jgi:hypothetical protein
LKRVEYREIPLPEALAAWVKSVRAKSPRKFSVRFFGVPPNVARAAVAPIPNAIPGISPALVADPAEPPRITLTLSNVPAIEVLKYLSNLANYHLDFTDTGVTLSAAPAQRLDWVRKVFALSPDAIARAKAEFAEGPLPRPEFSVERALALQHALPKPPTSIQWNGKRNALTVEGHLQDVDAVAWILRGWGIPLPKPVKPRRPSATETQVLALYTRLNAVVLRDVRISKEKIENALAALDRLCIAASGTKTGGLHLTVGPDLAHPDGALVALEAQEITAWDALKQILRQGSIFAHLRVHRGRLVVSGDWNPDSFPMGRQLNDTEGLAIGEYPAEGVLLDLLPQRDPDTSASAKDFLSFSGVTFHTGPFAMYSPATRALVLRDKPEFLLQVKARIWQDYTSPRKRKQIAPTAPVEIDGNRAVPEKTRD